VRPRARSVGGRLACAGGALVLAALGVTGLALGLGLGGCGEARGARLASDGAYIQKVSQTEATVAMVTADAMRLRVEIAPATFTAQAPADAVPGEVVAATATAGRAEEDSSPGNRHAQTFRGLLPDTAYSYRVLDADGGRVIAASSFHTAPPPGARAITFAAFGDSGAVAHDVGDSVGGPIGSVAEKLANRFAPSRSEDVAARIAERAPDLCLHTGDIVYPNGARERYAQAFFRPFAPVLASTPFFPSVGNHDVRTDGGAPFDEVFVTPANNEEGSERYYSFDYGDVHFVALDSETGRLAEPGSPQLRWLEEDLAATERAWKVCYFHTPPMNDGEHGDTEELKRVLVPVLEALGVDVVINGHDHNYQRFYPVRGITYVITGGGGKDTYPVNPSSRMAYGEAVFHFVLGTATARELTLEAVDLDGRVFDAVALVKDRDGDPGVAAARAAISRTR